MTPDARLGLAGQLYTDLNGLQKITSVGREDKATGVRESARQFEAMFLQQMLKSMREANAALGESEFSSSSEMQLHRDMYDQQLAMTLSQGKGIGLAEQLVRNLEAREKARPAADPAGVAPVTAAAALAPAEKPQASAEAPSGGSLWQQVAPGRFVRQGSMPQVDWTVRKPTWAASAGETSQAADSTPRGQGFEDRVAFIRELLPHAQRAGEALGIEPEWVLAQAALETGWGQKVIQTRGGQSSHNLFNIKASGDWQGQRAVVDTLEYRSGVAVRERAAFRAYDSWSASFDDYVALMSNERYGHLGNSQSATQFAHGLKRAGYATDPQYAQKVLRVLRSDEMNNALAQSGEPVQPAKG